MGELLDLSSGGVTALVQRLELSGHIERRRHPTDRRSVQLELSGTLVARAGAEFHPLVAALDELIGELSEAEQAIMRRFLVRAVLITEEHAARARQQLGRGEVVPVTPVPALWG